jgi:hypothetical protein
MTGLLAAACGGASFTQPAGTVAVNFTVDDSINKVYQAGEMSWKGSFKLTVSDAGVWNRTVAFDNGWAGGTGPYALLYDDGPWTTGGHEPKGAVANDNKWGITMFAIPPATDKDTYSYGLNDNSVSGYNVATMKTGDANKGWMWTAANAGGFDVSAGNFTEITAPGQTMPAFGTTDIKLVIDTNALATNKTWDKSKVSIKSSTWSWTETDIKDDGLNGDATSGDGKFTIVFSNVLGVGKTFKHAGLPPSGKTSEFVFVFNGVEYKNASSNAAHEGVSAQLKPSGGAFADAVVGTATNNNTIVTIP